MQYTEGGKYNQDLSFRYYEILIETVFSFKLIWA